jgi:hypothetical protein
LFQRRIVEEPHPFIGECGGGDEEWEKGEKP